MTDIISERMLGQRGHALEVAVSELFHYNGFTVERNKQTRVGEVDVMASTGPYTVVIECKEYNPSSAAVVIRDYISNVAKKTELLGFKNAVLVTSKPPSAELSRYAAEAGVTVRSLDDLGRIRAKLPTVAPEEKVAFMAREFNLAADSDNPAAKRRKLWLEQWVRNPSKDLAKQTAFNVAYQGRFIIGGILGALILIGGLAAYLVPAWRETILAIALLPFVAVALYLWLQQDAPKGKKKRRMR